MFLCSLTFRGQEVLALLHEFAHGVFYSNALQYDMPFLMKLSGRLTKMEELQERLRADSLQASAPG